MSQHTTKWFSLLLFGLLYLHSNAFLLPEVNSFRKNLAINLPATSTGVIDLKKDSNSPTTFYVEAYFSSSSQTSSNSLNSLTVTDTVPMMISIPNLQTLVASNCLGFSSYDCSKYNCQTYSYKATLDYPSFSADVTFSKSSISLDSTYWNLNSDYMYIATSCRTNDTDPAIGAGRYGVLGLGTASVQHFTHAPIFSIYLDTNLTGGKLLFKKDTNTYAQSSSPLFTFSANSTWQFPAKTAYLETPTSRTTLDGLIVAFDINSDTIGLPPQLYSAVLQSFYQILNMWCAVEDYKPYCYTFEELENLPDLTLSINDQKIAIPSKIYATLTKQTSSYNYFTFNFRAISPDSSGHSYVSPSFANALILGANFMSYYYTVFDASSGSNMIYLYPSVNASPVPEPKPDNSLIKWLALGVIGAVILAGVCIYAKKKRDAAHKNKLTGTPFNNTTTDGLNDTPTPQAPLVYNQQSAYNDISRAQQQGAYPPQPQAGMEYAKGYVQPGAAGTH